MLEKLRSFTNRIPNNTLATPKFTKYLGNLDIGMRRVMDRNRQFVTDPIPSAGIDYINSLITRADIKYLMKFPNDMDRFIRIQKEYNGPAYSDFIRQYSIKEKFFFYSEIMNTLEYLLVTDDYDILDSMPIGSNVWEEWLQVRPVKLLAAPTKELRLDNVATKLRYEYLPPVESVFSINVPKLLMMYTKYRLTHEDKFEDNTNNYPFIYKTCILPLLEDLNKTWILGILQDIVIGKSLNPDYEFDTDMLMFSEKSYFGNSNIRAAIKEIEMLIDKCVKGSIKPDQAFASLSTSPGTMMLDDLRYIRDNNYVKSNSIQYYWMIFVKEFPLVSLMVNTYNLQPDSSRTQQMIKKFNIVTNRLKNTKFWSHVKHPIVRSNIQDKFETLIMS